MSDFDDLDQCPYCFTPLSGYECWKCKVEFVVEGDKLVERALSSRGPRPEVRCVRCDQPMKHSSVLTAAWEDGDNSHAYVTCADCGFQNIMES